MQVKKYIFGTGLILVTLGLGNALAAGSYVSTTQQVIFTGVNSNNFELTGDRVVINPSNLGGTAYILTSTPQTTNGRLYLNILYCSNPNGSNPTLNLGLNAKGDIVISPLTLSGTLIASGITPCPHKGYTINVTGDPTSSAGYTVNVTFN